MMGAVRPNSSAQFRYPVSGIFFNAVCDHADGSRISPANGTPNSRSIR